MKNEKIRFSLSRRVALSVTVFALALSLMLIAISYIHYKGEMYEHYERFGMNVAAVAASQLDPDRIQTYLDTGEPDEAYEQAYRTLCQIRENGGVEYLYVVKPELDEVWYVLDTDPTEGAIPLGYHEPYYAGAFADNAPRMARGEQIEPIVSNEEFGWLMSVYYPMFDSKGESAGYVGVDILMNDVMRDLHSFARRMILLVALLTAAATLILIRVTSGAVVRPIRKLSDAAGRLVDAKQSGKVSDTHIFEQLTIRSEDEIGALYKSLSHMEQDMNDYLRNLVSVTAQNERITSELTLATRIQADMLPNIFPAFPDRQDFDIYATMDPAKEVGGDFYDFFLIDDDHLCMVMADVSGKGVPAALFMMASKIILANNAMMGKSPAQILTDTNAAICSNNREEMFVTVWLGILELSTGRLTAANAGHEYPVIRHANGGYTPVRDKHGFVVGGMDGVRYQEYELQLEPGARLFVYTDGVTEATNARNELFGADRMLKTLNAEAAASPEQVLKNVRRAVDDFVQDAEQFDDLTMLALEYIGPDAAEEGAVNELTLPAVQENIPRVTDFIDDLLDAKNCQKKAKMQINIAIDEIFCNIVSYAYAPGTGDATVRFSFDEGTRTAHVTFIDSGIPFDPLAQEDPDVSLPAQEREVGGLGIFMVKKIMDDVEYRYVDGRNELTIHKAI